MRIHCESLRPVSCCFAPFQILSVFFFFCNRLCWIESSPGQQTPRATTLTWRASGSIKYFTCPPPPPLVGYNIVRIVVNGLIANSKIRIVKLHKTQSQLIKAYFFIVSRLSPLQTALSVILYKCSCSSDGIITIQKSGARSELRTEGESNKQHQIGECICPATDNKEN